MLQSNVPSQLVELNYELLSPWVLTMVLLHERQLMIIDLTIQTVGWYSGKGLTCSRKVLGSVLISQEILTLSQRALYSIVPYTYSVFVN